MRVFAFPLGLEPAPLGAVEEREVYAAAFNPKTANKEAGGSGRRAVSRPPERDPFGQRHWRQTGGAEDVNVGRPIGPLIHARRTIYT